MIMLNRMEVQKCISMHEAIEAMKPAFAQLSAGKAIVPLRTTIRMEKHLGSTRFMPVYLADSDGAGIKVVSNFQKNRSLGLPTLIATVFLFDAQTGEPLAFMDGTYLTALRTGAASGLATDLLARPDSHVLAIFGAGAQGKTQLQAVCEVRDIRRVWVYDIDLPRAEKFVEEARSWGGRIPPDIRAAKTSGEAAGEADIICTATPSKVPVLDDQDLKEGCHLNGIGSFTPDSREIGTETVRRAKIVVDHRATALAEAGDLILPLKEGAIQEQHVYAELGELVLRQKRGREREDEITFFKSVGNAVQDLAVGMRVYQKAIENHWGTKVPAIFS